MTVGDSLRLNTQTFVGFPHLCCTGSFWPFSQKLLHISRVIERARRHTHTHTHTHTVTSTQWQTHIYALSKDIATMIHISKCTQQTSLPPHTHTHNRRLDPYTHPSHKIPKTHPPIHPINKPPLCPSLSNSLSNTHTHARTHTHTHTHTLHLQDPLLTNVGVHYEIPRLVFSP